MAPVIGIPLCLDARERWKPKREYLYLDRAYCRAVESAGGSPLLLPMQSDPARLAERIDGLLLPGGDDFLPDAPYAEPVEFDPAPPQQIAFDRALLESALDLGRPVLGICYGAQLIALRHGGRLHHHLPIDLPGSGPHRLDEQSGRHRVRTEPGTRLRDLLGEEDVEVNSLHHQAIDAPGDGMRIGARAADGVVEAIEAVDHPFLIGVQWHPERLDGPAGAGLFDALVAASDGG